MSGIFQPKNSTEDGNMSDWSDDTLDQLSALDANIITQSEGDANEPILLRHNG